MGLITNFTIVTTAMIEMRTGGGFTFNFKAEHNTLKYVLKEGISIDNTDTVTKKQLILINNDGVNFIY